MDSKQMKYGLALVGTGAVLAMGGLSVAIANGNAAEPQPVPAAVSAQDKVTNTGTPETSVAKPAITTAPYTIPTGEPQ